jgi:hypothetical protein
MTSTADCAAVVRMLRRISVPQDPHLPLEL